MTGPNSSHGMEESEKPQRSEADLYNELVNGFASNYILNGNLSEADKNQLITDIMWATWVASWTNIETQLQRYMASKDEFTGLDLSKINIFQLKNKVSGAFVVRKNNEVKAREQIIKDYQLSEAQKNQLTTKLGDLNWVWNSQLEKIIKSEQDRKIFLKSIFSDLPNTKIYTSILTNIDETESARRISRLGNDDKQSVKVILDRIHYTNKLDETDIDILRETAYLNPDEIQELVETFIPYMTLQQAVNAQLLDYNAASQIRDDIIARQASESNITLDDATTLEIQTALWLSEVLVSTKYYASTPENFKNVANEVWFKKFADDLERRNEEIKQELREKWPVSFDVLREWILEIQNPNLLWFEKFRDDSVLKFTTSRDGEESVQYIKLVWRNDEDRKFSFKKVWAGAINLSSNSEVESLDYNTFFENLKKWGDKIEVFSLWDVNEKIESWDIETSEFISYTEDDFSWADRVQKTQKIQEKYRDQLEREIESVKVDVEKNVGSTYYKARLEAKQKELEELDQSSLLPAVAAEKANLFQITDKLDDLDSDGKALWIEVGIFIETKENAFRISGIDFAREKIILHGLKGNEELAFSDFVGAFKKQKAVRAKNIDNFDRLIDRVGWKLEWWEYKTNGGKLVAKNIDHWGKSEDRKVEFLRGTKSDTLVKIISFNDGFVEIQRGEVEDTKVKKWKEEVDGHKLKIKGAEVESYSLNEFARFVEHEELVPDWKLWKKWLEVSPDSPHNARNNGNTFWWVMWKTFAAGRMSLAEVMAWGKMIPELMEEYFKRWSDIKSAKAALAMWKFLPKQMRDELLVKVERAESESMDKALEDLWKIDSWMAVKRIENWLLDKNTPEYNKEAWLLFMLSKYGHLTSKWAMYPYRWKWLWYEAFGWKVNDKLFLKKKAEAEADNQVFSEETLMHFLMKEQCKDWHYSGIRRRSRLHKEFENKWKSWVEEEFEKWYKDASNKRTAAKMIDEGMDEALWGTTTNALWWMKKAAERWGSLESMMEISFSLMFSGAAFDIDQATYLKAKWLWDGDGQPIVSQRFMSSVPEMKLFNDTILELSKEISRRWWDYSGMYDEALALADRAKNRTRQWKKYIEKERLQDTRDFWKKYWVPLSRALNFSMWDNPDYSETDTIIKRNKWKNEVFKQYYDKASGFVWEWNYFKEDFVDDWAWDTGIFGLNTYKLAEKYLVMDQGWAFKKWSPGKKVWEHMYGDINNTSKKILIQWEDLNSEVNKQAQIDYVTTQLEEISAALLSVHGGRPGILPSINSPTSHLWEQFNKWGVNVTNDLNDVSAKDIKAWEKRKYFQKAAKNIIEWINQDDSESWDTPVSLQEQVKKKVNRGVQWSDDHEYSMAA